MKPSELIPGYIYSDTIRYRQIDRIENGYVHYRKVGYLPIRKRIHLLGIGKCRVQTFLNWAKYEYTEALFIEVKKAM